MFVISEIGSLVNISKANGIGVDVSPYSSWEIMADFGHSEDIYTLATFQSEMEARTALDKLSLLISSSKNVNEVIDIRMLTERGL